jgi:alpha-amylase
MEKIYFLFGVHCHQPFGDEKLLEESYKRAYLPFFQTMEKFPQIKFSVNFSGVLYDYFSNFHPEFLDLLKKMIKRRQIEILSGGYYEPILSLIPDGDKSEQIKMENDFIMKKLDHIPRGFWLAERIWEPNLPKFIAQENLEYTLLDDYHFISAGFSKEDLSGYFITEDQGKSIFIFPIDQELRYLIPFSKPEKVIDYLMQLAKGSKKPRGVMLFDDGEKFGFWPGTNNWVYKRGYLETLCKMLINNLDWIKPITYSDFLENFPPLGRVYLPTSSYFEMTKWSLPLSFQKDYGKIIKDLARQDKLEKFHKFLHGGFFRNFFIKYEEANNLHKRMLHVSQKINIAKKSLERSEEERNLLKGAQKELFKSQCNSAFWHGIFGGLYLFEQRNAAYQNLINAEKILQKITRGNAKYTELVISDLNKDGNEEVVISNDLISAFISPSYGGSIFELDYKPNSFNLLNTLKRREEYYHNQKTNVMLKNPEDVSEHSIPNIQQLTTMKKGKVSEVIYDKFLRYSLLDRFFQPHQDSKSFFKEAYSEIGDFAANKYSFFPRKQKKEIGIELRCTGKIEENPAQIIKVISLCEGQSILNLEYELLNLGKQKINALFGIEFNFGFKKNPKIDFKDKKDNIFKIVDDNLPFIVSLISDKDAYIWKHPIFTVSQSETGLERTFQGISTVLCFHVSLKENEKWRNRISFKIES